MVFNYERTYSFEFHPNTTVLNAAKCLFSLFGKQWFKMKFEIQAMHSRNSTHEIDRTVYFFEKWLKCFFLLFFLLKIVHYECSNALSECGESYALHTIELQSM